VKTAIALDLALSLKYSSIKFQLYYYMLKYFDIVNVISLDFIKKNVEFYEKIKSINEVI
jgi:hypothetical protein